MRIVVAGTGTEIGKTHVSCALAHDLRSTRRVLALKPVESGGTEDARALSAACGVETSPLYALTEPLSPHLAARRDGRTIEVAQVVDWVAQREVGFDVTLIETAGGLYSPLAPTVTNATLAAELAPSVLLLVAPDRLGVLHDVTSTLLAWGDGHAARVVVVLSAPAVADAATGDNARELEALNIAVVGACFPRAPLASEASATQAARLAEHLFTES